MLNGQSVGAAPVAAARKAPLSSVMPTGRRHDARSSRRSCRSARPGAARRPGGRPRRLVGAGLLRPGGCGGPRRSSLPSSRRPASRSSSSSTRRMRCSIESKRRSRRGSRPDFLFGTNSERRAAQSAYEDQLVDLAGVLGPVLDLFDGDTIEVSTLLNGKTGRRGLYAMPMGRYSNNAPLRCGSLGSSQKRRIEQLWHRRQVTVAGEVEIMREPAIGYQKVDELLGQRNMAASLEGQRPNRSLSRSRAVGRRRRPATRSMAVFL